MKFKYEVVSAAVILRDIANPEYINDEHRMLVDIADSLYNANIGPEYLKPEYRALYDKYGKEFWNLVIQDASAIDSQVSGHEQELLADYADYLSSAINPYEEADNE